MTQEQLKWLALFTQDSNWTDALKEKAASDGMTNDETQQLGDSVAASIKSDEINLIIEQNMERIGYIHNFLCGRKKGC